MRLVGEKAWIGCVLVLAVAVVSVKTVRAEDYARAGSLVQQGAATQPRAEAARVAPRLAPPVLLSVEIVPDGPPPAATRCEAGVAACGSSAPPQPAALQGVPAGVR